MNISFDFLQVLLIAIPVTSMMFMGVFIEVIRDIKEVKLKTNTLIIFLIMNMINSIFILLGFFGVSFFIGIIIPLALLILSVLNLYIVIITNNNEGYYILDKSSLGVIVFITMTNITLLTPTALIFAS